MIGVGDKFIIEVGAVAELDNGKKKYFIKPFEHLVFDRKELEQLEKYNPEVEYSKGFYEATNKALESETLKSYYERGESNGYSLALKDVQDIITNHITQKRSNSRI